MFSGSSWLAHKLAILAQLGISFKFNNPSKINPTPSTLSNIYKHQDCSPGRNSCASLLSGLRRNITCHVYSHTHSLSYKHTSNLPSWVQFWLVWPLPAGNHSVGRVHRNEPSRWDHEKRWDACNSLGTCHIAKGYDRDMKSRASLSIGSGLGLARLWRTISLHRTARRTRSEQISN